LRAAKREGLKTVWIRGYTPVLQRQRNVSPAQAACVDIRLSSVMQLIRHQGRL